MSTTRNSDTPSMPRCQEIPKSEIHERFTSYWKPGVVGVEVGEQPEGDGAGAGGEQEGDEAVQLGPGGGDERHHRRAEERHERRRR